MLVLENGRFVLEFGIPTVRAFSPCLMWVLNIGEKIEGLLGEDWTNRKAMEVKTGVKNISLKRRIMKFEVFPRLESGIHHPLVKIR